MIYLHSLQNDIFEQFLTAQCMESRLSVKNFGPIKEVDLNLKNVNVFIGPQATGKSALAKIYTIFKAPRKFFYKNETDDKITLIDTNTNAFDEVSSVFKEYNIDSFLTPETEIEFDSELHNISYKFGVLYYHAKLREEAQKLKHLSYDFISNKSKLITAFAKLSEKFIMFEIRANGIINRDRDESIDLSKQWPELTEDKCVDLFIILEDLEDTLSTNTATYIPAERSFVNIIKKYALNLLVNNVPIPKHILNFGAEIEKLNLNEINLDFLDEKLKYKVIDGEDRIYIDETKSIMLAEAASGIQSVVPLLAFTLDIRATAHRSFVIEEPELNLFPLAQYELVKLLESQRKEPFGQWEDVGTIHTYTTHSPYILSSLNNLLYAYKVLMTLNKLIPIGLPYREKQALIEVNQRKVKHIVKAYLVPSNFTAYQISKGYAKSIFNKETGLIDDNFIDMASDKISEEFDALMELNNTMPNG